MFSFCPWLPLYQLTVLIFLFLDAADDVISLNSCARSFISAKRMTEVFATGWTAYAASNRNGKFFFTSFVIDGTVVIDCAVALDVTVSFDFLLLVRL